MLRFQAALLTILVVCFSGDLVAAESFQLRLRSQAPVAENALRFHRTERREQWAAAATAIIVCDMWDSHHCYRAVQRSKEFAPRLNQVLADARQRGATIIHAPSGCMNAYADHSARRRATEVPAVKAYPDEIEKWCYTTAAEDQAKYPIDQSDGGEDDTPEERAAWEAVLQREGRDVKRPWLRQMDLIMIDPDHDYISDQGKEIWSILQAKGISQVILTGVHTNMCVLGRPFGLRRMVQAGMQTVLMRDLTDTMYNPAAAPFVSHFSGTDLIIDHIERYVCPTITSDQMIGGNAFRFADDRRPEIAILINESEYETERTLPEFAEKHLRRDHRINQVFGSSRDANQFPGIEIINEADVLLISVRRRTPPEDQLAVIRQFVAAGKPVIGIRTANHAFHQRTAPSDPNQAQWPSLDADVFGGSYTNHYGNDLAVTIEKVMSQQKHAILAHLDDQPFTAGGSLYKVSPVDPTAMVLLTGAVVGHPAEPVAWTYVRRDSGRSFYTSLGAPKDFENPRFVTLLRNAIQWALQSEH